MERNRKKLLLVAALAAAVLLMGLFLLPFASSETPLRDRTGILGMGDWSPEDFVDLPPGAQAVFTRPPDLQRHGTQRLNIRITEADGSRTTLRAELRLLRLWEPLQFEIGETPQPFSPVALFGERVGNVAISWVEEPELLRSPGEQTLHFRLNGREYEVAVRMADTIPPRAVTQTVDSYVGAELDPMDFIEEIIDHTQVTARFAAPPDTTRYGQTQTVEIELTDEGGNQSTVRAELRIVEDGVPPEIHGLRDIHVGRGGTVAFRTGITVTHSAGEATLEIDSSAVNTAVPGEHEVVYIARSPAGQETRATARVIVSEVSVEAATALVTPVLAQIINDNMNNTQKARAIFDWVRANIAYNNTGVRGSVADGVYQGMNLRRGDCFTFYAITKFMLEQLGFATVSLERYPVERTRHYWLLVDLGEGWHHFDATPIVHAPPNYGFMMTASDVADFDPFGWGYYYRFDPARIPEGVEVVP